MSTVQASNETVKEKIDTYFVKDGWANGVVGERALTCGFGEQQKDGWYYMLDTMDDGIGPYDTEEFAIEAGNAQLTEEADEDWGEAT